MQIIPFLQPLLLLLATTASAISRSHKFYLDTDEPWENRLRRFHQSELESDADGADVPSWIGREQQAISDITRELHEAKMLQKAAEVESLYGKILLGKAESAFVAASTLQDKANEIVGTPSTEILSGHTKKEKKEPKQIGSEKREFEGESKREGEELDKAHDRLSVFARHLHRTPFAKQLTDLLRAVHVGTAERSPTARELYQLGLLSSYLNEAPDNFKGITSPKAVQTGNYEGYEEDDEELESPGYLAGPFRRRGIPEQDDLQAFLERFHKHAQASSERDKRQRMTPSNIFRTLTALQKISAE
uniref:Uncharacterized protein n=1 Tax=Schistocephalus solidus TaxID=70667 RepID=A0A0X3NZE0_SCHSO